MRAGYCGVKPKAPPPSRTPDGIPGDLVTLVVIHVALVPFTGGSVNPARSFGSSVPAGVWIDQWIYWIAPLVGAVVGWGVHKASMMEMKYRRAWESARIETPPGRGGVSSFS